MYVYCIYNTLLFTKLPWPGDSEGTFRSSSQAGATETTRPYAWFVTSLQVVRLIVLLFYAVVLLANKSAKSRGLALVCKAQ